MRGSGPPVIQAIASCSASWYRCACVRVSSAPAGAPSASSTAPTTAAHSGVRSPDTTPAPWNVVSSRTARSSKARAGSSSGRDRWYISAASPARSRRSIPALAADSKIASAAVTFRALAQMT